MSRDEFNKELKIDVKDAEKGLDKVNAKLDETDKSLGKVEKTGGVSWNKIAIGITAAVVAVKGFLSQISKYVDAANIQEKALRKVNFMFGDQSGKIIKLSKEIQELTTVGDEAAQEMMVLAKAMGATDENMEAITKGAIGLSEALGIDVNSAVKMVTAGIEGQDYTLLNRYLPSLRLAKTEAEKTAIFNETLARSWDLAKDATNTSAGALEQFKNKLGDLYEVIGGVINKGLTPFYKGMTEILDKALSTNELNKFDDMAFRVEFLGKKVNRTAFEQEEYSKLINQLKTQYPEYLRNLDVEKSSYEDIAEALQKQRDLLQDKIILEMQEGELNKLRVKKAQLLRDEYEYSVKIAKIKDGTDPFREGALQEALTIIQRDKLNVEKEIVRVETVWAGIRDQLNEKHGETIVIYEAEVEAAKNAGKANEELVDLEADLILKNLSNWEQYQRLKVAMERGSNAEILEEKIKLGMLLDEQTEQEKELWIHKHQEMIDWSLQQAQTVGAIFSQLSQAAMTGIDARYNKEKAALDASEMSHEDYQKALRKLEAQREKEKSKILKRQQKIDIAMAKISTAQAVMKAFAAPDNIITWQMWTQAALAAALGAAQINTIASQAFADGGIPGEDLLISDRKTGNPVAVMNSREYITPASTTNNPVSQGYINEALRADGRQPYFKGAKAPRDSSMSDSKPEFVIENRFDMDGIVTKITEKQNAMTRAGAQIDKL